MIFHDTASLKTDSLIKDYKLYLSKLKSSLAESRNVIEILVYLIHSAYLIICLFVKSSIKVSYLADMIASA